MSSSSIQADWDNRHFIANIQYNIMKVVAFLNEFDSTTRLRLAKLNEKLSRLERQMDYLEASVQNVAEASAEAQRQLQQQSQR